MFKLFIFFHLLGKIKGKNVDFELEGAKLFKSSVSNKLSLGKKGTLFITNLLEKQSEIFKLYSMWEDKTLNDKDKNFFWFKNKDIAIYLFIFSLAKFYSLGKSNYQIEKLKNFIIYLQIYYFKVYKSKIVEDPLLNGKEIMDILNLSSGRKIGEIKEKLLEAQISGIVKSKEEAINFVKSLK